MKKVHILKSAVGISLAVVFAFQGLGFGSGIKVFAENKSQRLNDLENEEAARKLSPESAKRRMV